MKLNKIPNLLKQCDVIAELSKDEEMKVGGILIDPKSMAQLTTGYNSFVRNAPDDKLPTKRPEKYEFILHCEQNIITNAARNGICTQGKVLVTNLSPCHSCARLLYQAGISEVYFKNLYRIYKESDLFIDLNDLYLSITDFGYFKKMDIYTENEE